MFSPAYIKKGNTVQKPLKSSVAMNSSLQKATIKHKVQTSNGNAAMNRINSSTALAYQNSINARPASSLNTSKQLTAKDSRRGSMTRSNAIETPADSKKAMQFFSKIGLPGLYKLDKLQYTRGEVADIGLKLSKKLEESESLLDYERRKSDELRNQKLELQQRVQEL